MSESTKRVKRLVSFRELERDRAGGVVAASRRRRDQAEEARDSAQDAAEQEITQAVPKVGEPVYATDMQLARGCVDSAKQELEVMEKRLFQAESEFRSKMTMLLEVHKKVKQMENLYQTLRETESRQQNSKEQREIDDLVNTKEGAR